jgi:hypothetical protein
MHCLPADRQVKAPLEALEAETVKKAASACLPAKAGCEIGI